jgi:hypothetical protein
MRSILNLILDVKLGNRFLKLILTHLYFVGILFLFCFRLIADSE